jgi:hypothetical protein
VGVVGSRALRHWQGQLWSLYTHKSMGYCVSIPWGGLRVMPQGVDGDRLVVKLWQDASRSGSYWYSIIAVG